MVNTGIDFRATFGARIDVGTAVDPAQSKFRLYVPVARQYPGVTVGNACALHPALVSLGVESVKSEWMQTFRKIAEIELTGNGMQTEEMTLETVAEPIAYFGLHEPVAHTVLAEVPGI